MRLDQIDDLELLVDRLDNVRKMGGEYSKVELSPYMELLLGISRTTAKQESVVKSALVAVGS